MNALQWLNDLAQWVGRFFPRLTLIPPTHRGVLFGPRGGASQHGPGLFLWWPIAQELKQIPVVVQSIQISARAIHVPEQRGLPRAAFCAVAVQYIVTDPVKAATKVVNLNALVDNRVQASIGDDWQGVEEARTTVARAHLSMSAELMPYGVEVQRIDVTDTGMAIVVLNKNDYGWNDGVSS